MSVHPRSDDSSAPPSDSNKRPRLEDPNRSIISRYPQFFSPSSNSPSTGLFSVLAPSLGLTPAEEPQVGITEYVDSKSESFSGIIKHRFTDFLVYEIGEDGKIVRLKDIKGPERPLKGKGKNQNKDKDDTAAKGYEPKKEATPTVTPELEAPLWNDQVATVFSPLLTPEKLSEFSSFVLAGSPHSKPSASAPSSSTATSDSKPPAPAPSTTTFTSSPIEDKLLRGKFHQSLRTSFGGKLLSAHKELEDGSVVIEVNWAKGNMSSRGRGVAKGRRERGDEQELREVRAEEQKKLSSLPPFIHFTLLKTNKESHDAISTLSRYFSVTPREIGIAGTKDKRAITVQRVSLKRGKKLTIEDVWRVARNGAGGGGGKGKGGWTDRNVRIGDVRYEENGLELGMLKGNKFVITLRDIDPTSVPTIHSSLSSLRSNGFLNYYGMQRFGTAPIPTHLIGLALLRSEWSLAVDLILSPRVGEFEDIVRARELWREGKRDEARKEMPKRCTAERCVMEAYKRGNESDHLGALSSIPKNLRLMYVHAWQSYIWNRLVSERVRLFGALEPVEGDLVYVSEGEAAAIEADSEEKAEKEDESLKDPSSAASQQAYYISTSSLPKVRALTPLDISSKSHTIYDVVLPMPGFAVTYPSGALGELYKRVIKEDGIDPDQMWRKQKEYSLGGTYRKILHLPQQISYKLLISTSSSQDLTQSDEDVLLGKPPLELKEYDEEKGGLEEGESLCLQVELELGSSTYATMALREILKSRTSSANQKSLTKEMEGRVGNGVAATSNGDGAEATGGQAPEEEVKKE
ncbi:pseudouridine synthase PUS7 [Sporobolomyces salmoneus]|uniref:pseudouridine synthase PUS7 n=1 Tax=Sporobolomyces salmoneus TaxID=183962 RepID=UPI0031818F55